MLDFEEIILNSRAYNVISLDTSLDRVSHAYLFVSQDDDYLYSFCVKVAKVLINLNSNGDSHADDLKINDRVHPDVKFLGLEKNIDKGIVEKIVEESNYSPFESNKKVFLLFNVQNMNETAQNKLLKTIEEPPANTYFILAGNSSSKLLPTILSRVKQIPLDNLTTEEICGLLIKNGVEKIKAEVCAVSSHFNASYAEKLAGSDDFLEFYNKIASSLSDIEGSRDVLPFSAYFNGKTIDKEEFLNIIITFVRDLAVIRSGHEELAVNKNVIDKLKRAASKLNYRATVELIDEILKQKKNLDINVNSTNVVDSVLFKIAEVKVKCRRL